MEDATSFAGSLKRVPWLAESTLVLNNGSQKIRVRAVEIERARKDLPRLIAESGLTLSRYELVLPDLEEIFTTIVSPGAGR